MTTHEAAEVLRLRKHLSTVLGILPQDFRGSTFWEDDDGYFVEHQWHKEAREALDADPGPLVAAVEGVVRALEELKAQVDTENTLCEGELLGECPSLSDAYHQANAALASYRAALGGTDEPR